MRLVDYTLWRNRVLLGHLRLLFSDGSDAESIGGMFEATPEFNDIRNMMQTRARNFPGEPFLQFDVPAPAQTSGPVRVPGRRLSPEEMRGAAPEKVLSVRDEAGVALDADIIALSRMDQLLDQPAFARSCRASGVDPSPWVLQVRLYAPSAGAS